LMITLWRYAIDAAYVAAPLFAAGAYRHFTDAIVSLRLPDIFDLID